MSLPAFIDEETEVQASKALPALRQLMSRGAGLQTPGSGPESGLLTTWVQPLQRQGPTQGCGELDETPRRSLLKFSAFGALPGKQPSTDKAQSSPPLGQNRAAELCWRSAAPRDRHGP